MAEAGMPEKETIERARKDKAQGKAPSTQAGEFVREEMEHIRQGKHGARSTKQAIAIGLSKARRSGVNLPPPKKGTASARTRKSAQYALQERGRKPVGEAGAQHCTSPRSRGPSSRGDEGGQNQGCHRPPSGRGQSGADAAETLALAALSSRR